MKEIKAKKTPFMVYKTSLLEEGYDLSKVKQSYRKKIEKLFSEFSDAEDRIKYMISFYPEIKKEFSYHAITKLPIPHPDLFFMDEVWNYVKTLIPSKKNIVITYIPELVQEFINIIISNKYNKLSSLIKDRVKEYGKEKVIGSLIKASKECGKFREIKEFLIKYKNSR